jgi:hypothetical protein
MTGILKGLAVSAMILTSAEEPGTMIPDTPLFRTSHTEGEY